MTQRISPARPAATVILLHDGARGPETFMLTRHADIAFGPGALVFPGGSVDDADRDPELRRLCRGADGLDDDDVAFRIAAFREAFEEAGVLLARDLAQDAPVDADRAGALGAKYRDALEAGDVALKDFLETAALRVALDQMVPFAHWITPEPVAKRFDTRFFLARAPADQIDGASHDGREAVDSLWIRPAEAIAEADRGERSLIFATRMNLARLAEHDTVADAIAAARVQPIVTVMPVIDKSGEEAVLRIPADAGYGVTSFPLSRARG